MKPWRMSLPGPPRRMPRLTTTCNSSSSSSFNDSNRSNVCNSNNNSRRSSVCGSDNFRTEATWTPGPGVSLHSSGAVEQIVRVGFIDDSDRIKRFIIETYTVSYALSTSVISSAFHGMDECGRDVAHQQWMIFWTMTLGRPKWQFKESKWTNCASKMHISFGSVILAYRKCLT